MHECFPSHVRQRRKEEGKKRRANMERSTEGMKKIWPYSPTRALAYRPHIVLLPETANELPDTLLIIRPLPLCGKKV